ncbi:unnamed protein product [Rotaria sp. Silwood1]|nr:unnamed protein product [Rotaria sp. Silwood1]
MAVPSKQLLLNVAVSVAGSFHNRTFGLLGTYDECSCKINRTSSPSSWTFAKRTCYYDLSVTNDKSFALTSLKAANEHLLIRENQKNPPVFNKSHPLRSDLIDGQQFILTTSAKSEYLSHTVKLSPLHQPTNSTFNPTTGVFLWKAIKGEHYLSIEARDMTYNLTSKHDIVFYVEPKVTMVVPTRSSSISIKPSPTTVSSIRVKPPSTTSNGKKNQATFIISIFGMICLFYR